MAYFFHRDQPFGTPEVGNVSRHAGTPAGFCERGTPMVRLLDDAMSRGFETIRQLISHEGFTVELGEAIRKAGGVDRAIRAMTQEFFPKEQTIKPATSHVSASNSTWREVDGVIYFTVTSDGTTGEQWIKRLESKGYRVEPTYAQKVLSSKDFKPTKGMTHEIAVLKCVLFSDNDRITQKIRDKATEMKLTTPNAEVACLIREMFSDKELEAMGLWLIVTMHEPIVSDGYPGLLASNRNRGGRWLDAYNGSPGNGWYRENGFAFVVPQVS